MADVTRILSNIEQGNAKAAEQLLPLVYDELRKLAAQKLAQEKPGQTLQATALVHEAYLRLVDIERVSQWNSRGHFFAAAAEAMRRIVLDRARDKRRLKRGGGGQQVEIDLGEIPGEAPDVDVLALDEALEQLEREDPDLREPREAPVFRGPRTGRSRRIPRAPPAHGRQTLGVRPSLALRPARAGRVTVRWSWETSLAEFGATRAQTEH